MTNELTVLATEFYQSVLQVEYIPEPDEYHRLLQASGYSVLLPVPKECWLEVYRQLDRQYGAGADVVADQIRAGILEVRRDIYTAPVISRDFLPTNLYEQRCSSNHPTAWQVMRFMTPLSTWQSALRLAGASRQFSRYEMLKAMSYVAETLGWACSMPEYDRQCGPGMPRSETIDNNLGWTQAWAELGFVYSRRYALRYPANEMLAGMRYVAEKLGFAPTATLYDATRLHRMAPARWIMDRFGSWTVALERAGLGRVSRKARRTRAPRPVSELLAAIQLVAQATHEDMSEDEYREYRRDHPELGLPSRGNIRVRLGGFPAARRRAGLSGTAATTYSDQAILDAIRAAADFYGGTLLIQRLYEDWRQQHSDREPPAPESSTAVRRFGSWTNARKTALAQVSGTSEVENH